MVCPNKVTEGPDGRQSNCYVKGQNLGHAAIGPGSEMFCGLQIIMVTW